MQKIWKVFVASFLVLVCACGTNQNIQTSVVEEVEEEKPQETIEATTQPQQEETNQTAIVYFSRAGENYQVGVVEKGNTKMLAEAMGKVIEEGLIRGWGLSQVDIIDRAQQVTPLTAIQNIYSMVERDSEERILENLDASLVTLTEKEFQALEEELNSYEVYGHRGLGRF